MLNITVDLYSSLISISDGHSKDQIITELSFLIYFVSGSLLFLFLITFAYFIPYFSREIKILDNIDMIIKMFEPLLNLTLKKNEMTESFKKTTN